MVISLHDVPSQYPKTPKLKSLNLPKGTACIIGVDRTETRSRANAANSTTESGVAGRNLMMATIALPAIAGNRKLYPVSKGKPMSWIDEGDFLSRHREPKGYRQKWGEGISVVDISYPNGWGCLRLVLSSRTTNESPGHTVYWPNSETSDCAFVTAGAALDETMPASIVGARRRRAVMKVDELLSRSLLLL